MRRILIVLASLLALSPAKAADSTVTLMISASAFGGTELLYVVQGAADRKGTPAQMATYTYSLMSGDCTVAASVITCAKINGTTFPASGTSGGIPYFSGTNAISSSAALTANLPVIGGGAGVAPSVGTRSGNTTAFVTTTGTQTNGSYVTIDASGNHIAGTAPVTSVTPGAGIVSGVTASCTQTAITGTGTLSIAGCVNAQVGTTYTVLDGDRGKLVTFTNAASIAVTLPQAGTGSAFANGWVSDVLNRGAGTVTITPTTSTINGTTTLVLTTGQGARIFSDGTNYQVNSGSGTGSGTVTSIATSCGISGGTITTTGTLSAIATSSVQTGANYAFQSSDCGKIIYLNNAANQIPTIAQAGTGSFTTGWFVEACNIGAGTQTITPATSTIGGAATYVLAAGSAAAPKCVGINSDGTNYVLDLTGPYSAPPTLGTNVSAALANTLSSAGGVTSTIASGTSALGTSAISSATCATVVTTTATNTATTDVVTASFNGDPTAVTGYVPLTTGMLTIIAYPTSGNVNFKVCNNTSSSITPGAITLNWRVVR